MNLFRQKWILLVAPLFLIMSCRANQKGAIEDASHSVRENLSHKNLVILDEQYPTPPAFRVQLEAVFLAYLNLKDAFVASNNSTIDSLSHEMEQAVLKLNDSLLVGEGLVAVENHKSVLQHSLSQLIAKSNLYDKRVHFSHISEALYCSIKSFGLVAPNKIYTAYCPMAFENTGAFWLSNAEEILNPYFGAQMLTCGEIREVLE